MMFAIITPALITGAFANRVSFKAYLAFLTAWLFLVLWFGWYGFNAGSELRVDATTAV